MANDKLKNIFSQWDGKKWHKPDDSAGGYAVWYGPGDEPESATEIGSESGGWEISEYQFLGGLVDDEDLQDKFSKQTTFVSYKEFAEAVEGDPDTISENADEEDMLRHVVGFGVAKIAYYGGDEETVDELP